MKQSGDADVQSLLVEEQSDAAAPGRRGHSSPAVKLGVCGLGLLLVAAVWSARIKPPTERSHIRGVIEKNGIHNGIHKIDEDGFDIIENDGVLGQDPDHKESHVWTLVFKESAHHLSYNERKALARKVFGSAVVWIGRSVRQIEVHCTREEVQNYVQDFRDWFEFAEEENHNMRAIPELPSDEHENQDHGDGDHEHGDRRLEQEDPPSWGVDRSDQRALPLSDAYQAPPEDNQGQGVHIYIFDTGIRTSHVDFGGRAINTLEVLRAGSPTVCNGDTNCASDADGHGTHCAGSAAGTQYGLAKRATIHSVKILSDDGEGSFDWFNVALDWVIEYGPKPAVVSASLGGAGRVRATKRAITTAVNEGVVVVVAAGNENDNACGYTPAFVPAAITVGSTRSDDTRSDFSNKGNCVDIFAPGTDITSASHRADHAAATFSGTSMACPHVAGACALLRSGDPTATARQVAQKLIARATHDLVHDRGQGSPNELLYVGSDEEPHITETPTQNPGNGGDCASTGWRVDSGECRIDEHCCLTSPHFGDSNYGDNQQCVIEVGSAPGHITQEHFETENNFDFLSVGTVDGDVVAYHGETGPHGIQPQPHGTIHWSSDQSNTESGFKLCLGNREPCPESGWRAPAVCPETWTYKDELVHGCTERDHDGGWCMHDDHSADPFYVHWWDKWADCERCE